MPKYRITMAYNARVYRETIIDAPDDQMAIDLAKNGNVEFPALNTVKNDFDPVEAEDRIYMVDRLKEDESIDAVVCDQVLLQDQHPYSQDAVELVRQIAEYRPGPNDFEVLRMFIAKARYACGKPEVNL